jgi:hypothetical protein
MGVTKAAEAELRTVKTSIPARMERRGRRALKEAVEQGSIREPCLGRYAPVGGPGA